MTKQRELKVKKREECTVVPIGVSCTETPETWYIRIRPQENTICTIRVSKKTFITSSQVEIVDDEF